MSSFDVIRRFKRSSGFEGKIGHAGTLDVFASGLMILLLGKATRDFDRFQQFPKTYRAGVRLGYRSQSLDIEGQFSESVAQTIRWADVEAVLPEFLGKQSQKVPAYSAAKFQGKALYEYARQGQSPDVDKVKEVEIFSLSVQAVKFPLVTFDVSCSSGTYVRQLSADIFERLGQGSFLYFLERRAIGPYLLQAACSVDDFSTGGWQSAVQESVALQSAE